MRRASGSRLALAVLLAFTAVYRVSLLGRGAVAFVDETLYFKATMALRALASGRPRAAMFDIVTNNARPGDAVVKMVPAALQAIPFAFGVPVTNPMSLLIPTACNVVVSLALVWLVFRLAEVFTAGDGVAAVTAAVVYALLASSNVYVRHLVPYDWALALALVGVFVCCARPATRRRAALAGLIAGSVFVMYPGYYPLVAVIVVAAGGAGAGPGGERAVRSAIAAACSALPVAAMQAGAWWAGFDYLGSARELSGTITGGSFGEGWTFLLRYLVDVERAAGVILLAGFAGYLVAAAVDVRRRRRIGAVHVVMAAAIAGWAWQAALSSIARKMVLYGRLIHPWTAMLAFALAFALSALPAGRAKAGVCAAIVVGSLASWASWAGTFYRLAYPRDVLYALSIDTDRVPADRRVCEFEPTQIYETPPTLPGRSRPAPGRVTLVNMCQGYPVADRLAAPPPPGAVVRFDGVHFERYAAYGFEGYTPDQRAALARRDYRVRVYER